MSQEQQPQQQLQVINETPTDLTFGNSAQFEHAQRVALMLSKSTLIPKDFQGNVQNTMIALEMANRIGASPLMVMQNLYIVHGKPSWSSTFIISAINACGRFSPLRFEVEGAGDTLSCYSWAYDKKTGDKLAGPKVTMQMAKDEGWFGKAGSKWKTMPELMIRYRSAAFFGRLYAPDILMGMHAAEEVEDFTEMMTYDIEQQIEALLNTSNYNEAQQRGVRWKIAQGISQRDAYGIIADLKMNQLNPLTEGLPGGGGAQAGDIKRHMGDLLA